MENTSNKKYIDFFTWNTESDSLSYNYLLEINKYELFFNIIVLLTNIAIIIATISAVIFIDILKYNWDKLNKLPTIFLVITVVKNILVITELFLLCKVSLQIDFYHPVNIVIFIINFVMIFYLNWKYLTLLIRAKKWFYYYS